MKLYDRELEIRPEAQKRRVLEVLTAVIKQITITNPNIIVLDNRNENFTQMIDAECELNHVELFEALPNLIHQLLAKGLAIYFSVIKSVLEGDTSKLENLINYYFDATTAAAPPDPFKKPIEISKQVLRDMFRPIPGDNDTNESNIARLRELKGLKRIRIEEMLSKVSIVSINDEDNEDIQTTLDELIAENQAALNKILS